VAARDWRFVITQDGRPEISSEGDPSLRFNLSNTPGLVVCAVVRHGEIGVDAESVGRAGAHLELAERYFAPTEVAALRTLPLPAQPRRFCEYWTLKESHLKARGAGLGLPVDRFAFLFDPGHSPHFHVDPGSGRR